MMNILLPTDFSENSRNAAVYALQFFEGVPCSFHFLHVSPISRDKMSNGHQVMPKGIKKKFDKLMEFVNGIKKKSGAPFSNFL